MNAIERIKTELAGKGWKPLANGTMEKVVDEYTNEDLYGRTWTQVSTANVELYEHQDQIWAGVYLNQFVPEEMHHEERFDEGVVTGAGGVEELVAGL